MALLYRSMVEVGSQGFVDAAPALFEDWVRWKLADPELTLPADGEAQDLDGGGEVRQVTAGDEHGRVFRGHLFEQRDSEQVKTTFSAITDGTTSWSWIDLQRWTENAWDESWLPYVPSIVRSVLEAAPCRRGTCRLESRYKTLNGDGGEELAATVLDADRDAPIVVVSHTKRERENDDMGPARDRAAQLQRRLAGIAPVYLLGPGAVSSFSRAMLAAGDQMDVYEGAVRTYLPGAGRSGDIPWRHRVVPFRRFDRGPSDRVALLVAPPVARAATHQSPPPVWSALRELPELGGGLTDSDLSDLVDLAEDERTEALRRASEADARADEADVALELERETVSEILAERNDLVRRLRYAHDQLRKRGEAPEEPVADEPTFDPESCAAVVEHADASFEAIAIGPRVAEGAEQLDRHGEQSWARKGLLALEALQAYAEWKQEGENGSFLSFCNDSGSLSIVPATWVSLNESETTNANDRYRGLRTFPVDTAVDESGEIYMASHIKIEKGGTPAPRIHFHDDTDGATGQVHVGWFGPHRDSKSKS
jgi:hypothetical protein